jgi:hypothetical protein
MGGDLADVRIRNNGKRIATFLITGCGPPQNPWRSSAACARSRPDPMIASHPTTLKKESCLIIFLAVKEKRVLFF